MPAPGGWFDCRVLRAGPGEGGKVFIALKEKGGKFDSWFFATDAMKREMLATALTALSTGLMVHTRVASIDPDSQIDALFLLGA